MRPLSPEQYFDAQAHQWNENYKRNRLFIERLHIVQLLMSGHPLLDKMVLDLGCGTGIVSSFFSNGGAKVEAIDISSAMIEEAKLHFGKTTSINFQTGDASMLPFPDSHFDIVSCISVLEWADDDKKILSEISRVLKINGIAIISVPNKNSISRRIEKFISKTKSVLGFSPGYLYYQRRQYSPIQFEKDCTILGLKKMDDKFYVMPLNQFAFISKMSSTPYFGMIYFIKVEKN